MKREKNGGHLILYKSYCTIFLVNWISLHDMSAASHATGVMRHGRNGHGTGFRHGATADAAPAATTPATVTDANRLKALSHPHTTAHTDRDERHRTRHGRQIAEQLGESAGTVSYHLKQLEKGRIRHANAITRRRQPQKLLAGHPKQAGNQRGHGHRFGNGDDDGSGQLRVRQEAWQRYRSASDNLPKQWTDPTVTSSSVLRLTSEEYARMSQELRELFNTWTSRDLAHEEGDGSQPVMLNIDAFRWLP